jgi:energy-coupling factor transporter ATP-binding protein EcfA2
MNPVLRELFDKSVLIGEAGKPIIAHYHEGSSKLLIVTGDNASGKSMVRRAIGKYSRDQGFQVLHFSPEGKAQGGIVGAIIYGTEEHQSTGSNSARTILGAISTSLNKEDKHIIIFDEPDSGLSDEFAAGAGDKIAEFVRHSTEALSLVVVISHRRELVRRLLPQGPAHLSLGSKVDLREWLDREAGAVPLEKLIEKDLLMFRMISSQRRKSEKDQLRQGAGV